MTTDPLDVVAIWAEARDPQGRRVMGVSATNRMPWPTFSADLRIFREASRDRVLVMGRKTFESLPKSMRVGSPDRPLVVLTSSVYPVIAEADFSLNVSAGTFESPEDTLRFARAVYPDKGVAVIGGPSVINSFAGLYDRGSVTTIPGVWSGDVLAPSAELFGGYRSWTFRQGTDLLLTQYERTI